jgi:thiamine transport system substrate-binding protein
VTLRLAFFHLIRIALSFSILSAGVSARAADAPTGVLSILTYDSLMAEGGLGPEVVSRFEKSCGCRLKIQVAGDAAQMISRLQLEQLRGRSETQVVVGVDQALWPQVRAMALKWTAAGDFEHTVDTGFTPLDYGVMGWIWNPEWKGFAGAPPEPPKRWNDLLDSKWKRRLLLQDPRTSTPGLGFVLGARTAVGELGFFKRIRAQWMTLAAGWAGSYGLFLKGEAPLVWSYTTSQAYHLAKDPKSPLRALVFEDGNPIQIEGSFIVERAVADAGHRELAQRFVQLLATREIQERIPKTQWMLPALKGVALPAEFQSIPVPRNILRSSGDVDLRGVLREWEISIR